MPSILKAREICNLESSEKNAFAETAFKRLYWQGYKGHFGEFRWPTGNGFDWMGIVTDPHNYNNSESNAWASANGLLSKLNNLDAIYSYNHVYLMAHSMGNVVAGEALKQTSSQVVNTYIAMQGAVPAHCYDANATPRTIPFLLDSGTPNRYANYGDVSNPHHPDSHNPVIIKMWRLGDKAKPARLYPDNLITVANCMTSVDMFF